VQVVVGSLGASKKHVGPAGEHVALAINTGAGVEGRGVAGDRLVGFAGEAGEPRAGSVEVGSDVAGRVPGHLELGLGALQERAGFAVVLLLNLKAGDSEQNAGELGVVTELGSDGGGMVEEFAGPIDVALENLAASVVVDG
jgi:hypothetical protein